MTAAYTGRDLYRKIVHSAQHCNMIFLGEIPHHNQAVNSKVSDIVIEMAKNTDFRAFAKESLYCLHPFMEEGSFSSAPSPWIQSKIAEYNTNVKTERKVIATAVDLAHSIKHSPRLVKDFFKYQLRSYHMAGFADEIISLCESLAGDVSSDRKLVLINRIGEITEKASDELAKETYDELIFYLNLLEVSLSLEELRTEEQHDLRNEWFIQTINRAMTRMEKYKAKMILQVGLPHAYKIYVNEDDYFIGTKTEASHFNETGNVFSIMIRPFYINQFAEPAKVLTDPIEKYAHDRLGERDAVYVDLHEYRGLERNTGIERYYKNGTFQFDGILYLKDLS